VWAKAREVLRTHFGYPDFRPGQADAIRSILTGRDSLVVMPTGGGKSICYQVPALLLPGLTLVVSPLIALMLDQVSSLEARRIPAALINSTLTPDEIHARLARALAGDIKLLYVAPERFESAAFRRALERMDVSMVAVDEAHCVCEWGHDFRPSYLKLREVWPLIGAPPVLALTATATPEARHDIVAELRLRSARVIVRGFDRPNLHWIVRREEKLSKKTRMLVRLLGATDEVAIVYAATRKLVESAAELLRGAGIHAAAYHAGLSQDVRARVQEAWTTGEVPVVVATNAFGMGVDKPDVRRVIHFQMPGSLEAYYQEAGRAGRDGEPAECILLHSYRDRFTHEFFIRASHPPRKVVLATYRALREASERDGRPVPAARFAHRVPGIKSTREVYSALRILSVAGAVENAAADSRCAIRWIVSPGELEALAADGDVTAELEPSWLMLRGLSRASRYGRRRSLRLSLRELARFAGGDFASARLALDALQAAGVLGWRADTTRSGYRPTDPGAAAESLSIDWRRVATRRSVELRKLKRMEGYAYQRGCRRRYLLRYFGEDSVAWRCGSCDRCAPRSGVGVAP
jgi:ATP-dependent DNA helicase RecQ